MTRPATTVDALADQYFEAEVALSPIEATGLGRDQRQDEWDDLSPTGIDQRHSLVTATLQALQTAAAADPIDTVTIAALRERLGLAAETAAAGADLMDISNIASGLHSIRETLDLMPMASAADWATIARRLSAIPAAITGWFESQFAGIEAGFRPGVRQVDALAAQVTGWIADDGFFADLPNRARAGGATLPAEVGDQLDTGVAVARQAYANAATRLRDQVRPLAMAEDGVGPTRYALASRWFLGTSLDYAATYRWGLEQVAELDERQADLCAQLRPGLSVADTKLALDHDPAYRLDGTEAMRAWMQARADEAIAQLDGVDFDIAEPARRIECLIAPTHDGAIYYTEPSADFTRPGRMWWSVPQSETSFATWRELTTVYHEGVPGHHLQCTAALLNAAELNQWRRQGIWVSGHGEGWALYAEQLMAELGYLDDPASLLGLIDSQAMRAARVVIDLGIHCGFAPPPEVGGDAWTYDKALAFFNARVANAADVARFEITRYCGWPGQAASYKIGQRVWTDIREQTRARQGAAFRLKNFHARALGLGALGLDTLRTALLGD